MRKTSLQGVFELAKKDDRVVFIGSDLGPGVLDEFKSEIPDRFFMEGISEQYVIGMAAGMAMDGFIPYVNTIASFITRRCYEQVALDLCLHDLPVRLIGNGGGVVYAPLGPTHLAVEDIAIFRVLPNMAVVAPCDADEMSRLMDASLDWTHPMYIRLAKGGERVISDGSKGFQIGKAIMLKEPGQALFVTTGVMAQVALQALDILEKAGVHGGLLHMHTIKPLDEEALAEWIPKVEAVVTVEEHTRIGGFGSAVLEYCSDAMPEEAGKIVRIGFPDRFAEKYGSQNDILDYWGITPEGLAEVMLKKLKKIDQ